MKQPLAGPYHEPELTDPVALCDERGRLLPASIGWSRQPLHLCNLQGRWPRKKRWNYWCITGPSFLLSVTLADLDYLGLASVYFLEYESKRLIEQTVTVPLGRGLDLPPTVNADVVFDHRKLRIGLREEGAGTHIRVESPAFGGAPLAADLLVERPPGHETLNVVIPWSDRLFQFTSKQNTLPAHGEVVLGADVYRFDPDETFGCLDYGRGIWPYSTKWNWGACSGRRGGRTIGLNLGGTWTDGAGMNENGVCIDGRLTKISEDLVFTYDRSDYMKPWTIRTRSSGRVDLRLVPFFERVARTNLLVLRSEVHQVFGPYSGTVVTDDGDAIALDGILGWVEQHDARW